MRSELDEAIQRRIEEIKARTEAMRMRIGSSHMETVSAFKPKIEKVTMACREMEACQEEEKPASADRKPEAAQQEEVPLEDAEVMSVGEPKKKRRRDRKLAAQHHRQKPETSIRENCGPHKRLAVARTGTSRRVEVARQKKTSRNMPRRTTQERHLQAEHNPPCESGTADEGDGQKNARPSKNRLTQEKRRQEKPHRGHD
jgi:hypothetical protein